MKYAALCHRQNKPRYIMFLFTVHAACTKGYFQDSKQCTYGVTALIRNPYSVPRRIKWWGIAVIRALSLRYAINSQCLSAYGLQCRIQQYNIDAPCTVFSVHCSHCRNASIFASIKAKCDKNKCYKQHKRHKSTTDAIKGPGTTKVSSAESQVFLHLVQLQLTVRIT